MVWILATKKQVRVGKPASQPTDCSECGEGNSYSGPQSVPGVFHLTLLGQKEL